MHFVHRPEQLHLSKVNTGMTVILAKEHHVILAKILCHLIERGALAVTAAHPNVVIEIDQRCKLLAAGRWFLCFGARTLRQEHCRACQCDVTKSFHRLKLLKPLLDRKSTRLNSSHVAIS